MRNRKEIYVNIYVGMNAEESVFFFFENKIFTQK